MKKILIIQTTFIGDVILATPVAEKLHRLFPEAAIDFLLRKGNEELFENHPFLHEVICWDKKNNKIKNLFRILKKIRQTRYDLIVTLHRFSSSGFITAFSKASRTIGFDKNPFSIFFSRRVKHIIGRKDLFMHEIDRNLSLIAEFGDQQRTMPRLYPQEKDFLKIKNFIQKDYICIAPASVWFTKQFPKEKWIEFIKKIKTPLAIYLIGGGKDKELCSEIISQSGNQFSVNFAGELRLLETAALMKNAKMNFVNDSSPMHIASAMNADVTAVFCSTIPAFGFGPLSVNSFVIETEKVMKCKPCGIHGLKSCPENHFECAYTIDTDKILRTITN